MKWASGTFLAMSLCLSFSSSSASECDQGAESTCRMAKLIASTMDQVPGNEDNISVTASGGRVSYSVITGMTKEEVDASPVSMYAWASDAQEAMCSMQIIQSFLEGGGQLWYGLVGKDFEKSLLELRCRKTHSQAS